MIALVTTLVVTPTPASADRQADSDEVTIWDVARANARYHSLRVAEGSGYSGDVVPMCMDDPRGGMGVHWIHTGRLTDGEITPTRPEALVYEVRSNGTLRLVAVEWVMPPNSIYPPEPEGGIGPMLFGEEFTWHPDLQVWKLHAWLYRENPDGLFADYNPTVGMCPTP